MCLPDLFAGLVDQCYRRSRKKKESGIESRVFRTSGAVVPALISVFPRVFYILTQSSHRHPFFHLIIRMSFGLAARAGSRSLSR